MSQERPIRVEAMLAELLRRFTPREAVPFMEARLEAYVEAARAGVAPWITDDGSAEGEA